VKGKKVDPQTRFSADETEDRKELATMRGVLIPFFVLFSVTVLPNCRRDLPSFPEGEIGDLNATILPPLTVHLQWRSTYPLGTGYQVYRQGEGEGEGTLLAVVYSLEYLDPRVSPGKSYAYWLVPERGGVTGPPSSRLRVTLPDKPLPSEEPETILLESPPPFTSQAEIRLSFVGLPSKDLSLFLCQIDGDPPFYCVSPLTLKVTGEGPHRFEVRAVLLQGISDPTPAVTTWVLDRTPPLLFWIQEPPRILYRGDPIVFGSDEPAQFTCSLNNLPLFPCTPPLNLDGYPFGPYTIKIIARDRAGNPSLPLQGNFWLAHNPPETTILSSPAQPIATLPVTIAFSGTHPQGVSGFECSLGGSPWSSCTSPYTLSSLPPGTTLFSVRALARDGEPDPTPATTVLEWILPETIPLWYTARYSPYPTFAVELLPAEGVTGYLFRLDDSPPLLTSPTLRLDLPTGTHQITLSAVMEGVSDPTPLTLPFQRIPPDLVAERIATGYDHACLLDPSGTLSCFGINDDGQLGTGDLLPATLPEPVSHPLGRSFQTVAVGKLHTCAGDSSGSLYCFGSNHYGQLGLGSPGSFTVPVEIPGVTGVTEVCAGGFHTCIRDNSGQVFCTGLNSYGAIGDGTTETRFGFVPVTFPEPVTSLACGKFHTVVIGVSGKGYAWGWNGWGQLGLGISGDALLPTTIPGGYRWLSLSPGDSHTCGIAVGGELLCFGDNRYGQLNGLMGNPVKATEPVLFPFPRRIATVATGTNHTCFLTEGGTLFCMGANENHELGVIPTSGFPQPVSSAWEAGWLSVTSKGTTTCGIRSGSYPFCFGISSFFNHPVAIYLTLAPPGR
jgi:hypothetical protein